MYIGIAGNIGSGKTTLAHFIAEMLGWKIYSDHSNQNPYLRDFYENMSRWAYQIQVYFLTSRFKSAQQIMWSDENVVQDRTIYEDAYIFAENLYQNGILERRDFNAYMELFNTMNTFLRQPDLLIYLKASVPTLMKQIRARNNGDEINISRQYLEQLNDRYDKWMDSYKGELIVIDADNFDLINSHDDRRKIIDIIVREISNRE